MCAAGGQLAWRHAIHPDAVGPQLLCQSFCEGHQCCLADGIPAHATPAQTPIAKAIVPRHTSQESMTQVETRTLGANQPCRYELMHFSSPGASMSRAQVALRYNKSDLMTHIAMGASGWKAV